MVAAKLRKILPMQRKLVHYNNPTDRHAVGVR